MIRYGNYSDINQLISLYLNAKVMMEKMGNQQWQSFVPTQSYFALLIKNQKLYVCYNENSIYGAFIFQIGIDDTYLEIDGDWLNNDVYGVIHKLVSLPSKHHVFEEVFEFCLSKCNNLRIDTHEDNLVMKYLLTKYGFIKCGMIKLPDQTLRIAYQYERK